MYLIEHGADTRRTAALPRQHWLPSLEDQGFAAAFRDSPRMPELLEDTFGITESWREEKSGQAERPPGPESRPLLGRTERGRGAAARTTILVLTLLVMLVGHCHADTGGDATRDQASENAESTFRASHVEYLGTTPDGLSLVFLGTDEYDMVPIFSLTVYVVGVETGTIRRTIRAETYPQTDEERQQKAALEAEIAGMGLRAGLVTLDEQDFRLVYSEVKSDLGLFNHEVSFRLWHQPTDQSIEIGMTLIAQMAPRSTEIREAWRTLDGNTWCLTHRTPAMAEGYMGQDGVWVIDRHRLSELANRAGTPTTHRSGTVTRRAGLREPLSWIPAPARPSTTLHACTPSSGTAPEPLSG